MSCISVHWSRLQFLGGAGAYQHRECLQGIPRYFQLWERALHGPLSSLLHFLSWESMDNHPMGHLSHTRWRYNALLGAELGRTDKENPVE